MMFEIQNTPKLTSKGVLTFDLYIPLPFLKEVKNFFLLRYVLVSLGSASYSHDSYLSELLPSLPGASQVLYDVGKSRVVKTTKLCV